MSSSGAIAGTHWRGTGFFPMRAMILLPLLVLAACGEKKDSQPGAAANIVDQAASNVTEVPQGTNVQSAEPASGASPSESPAGATIPVSLQGRWTGIDENCADRATERELTITPSSLVFLESEGKATGISHGPDGSIRIAAAFTGEGQSWTKRLELRLSASGKELTVMNDGTAITRKRCS